MFAAAACDVATLTIPNKLNAAIAALFLVLALGIGTPVATIGWHVLAALCMLALWFGLFALNLIGGGDAKLAAAVSLWLGPAVLLDWLLWTAVFGGLLGVAILLLRAVPLPSRSPAWLARLHDRGNGLPYGVAIGGAAILVYPSSSIFDAIMKIAA
jgi:prepilin peptidase CpaA